MAVEKGVGFPITATDQFSGAFASLTRRVSDAQGGFSRLTSLVTTFTAGLGAAGIASFVKGVIDAHDEVNKLSQKLGIGVGQLSQFKYAAELSDVSSQTLAAGIKGLSQTMTEAGDKGSKAGKILAAMGVDVKDGVLPAIEKMADVFAQMPDGPTKTALAVEVFKKSGMDMIPLLNQGSAGIAQLRTEADKLGLTMTDETARAAEQFNDNLRAVKASGSALGVSLLNEIAPGLLSISQAMKQAAIDGGALKGILAGLREAFSQAFFGDPDKNRITAIREELALLEPMLQEAPELADRVAGLNKELRGLLSMQDLGKGGGAKPAGPAPANKALEDLYRNLLGAGKAGQDAQRDAERLREQDLKGWVAYAEAVFSEADETNLAIAKINAERWAQEDKLREQDLKGWVAYAEAVFREADETNLAIAKSNEERWKSEEERWSGFLGGVDSAFRTGWDAFTDGAKDAGAVARDALKRTLFDWIYTAFAKPFVLNIVASLAGFTGLTGLSAAAQGAAGGGGGFLGIGSNLLGVGNAIGSLLPGGAVGTAFGNIAQMGAGMLGLSGSVGSMIGSVASFLPGIGAAIAVASMLYQAFNDGPENPSLRIFQGQGGSGLFGGIRTEGNYSWDNTGINAYIGGLDARLARILGPTGTAAATAGLSAYTQAGLRGDGQPAQFAFPEGDATAAEQLAREVLQSRYGIIFQQIDSTIAETIRTWSGTSTELQTYIETALGIVEGLGEMGVTGLNITTLQLMAREGEALAQTFQRVAGTWSWFTQNFYTEAERLEMATTQVSGVFAQLGLEVPGSVTEFRRLVEGLDLSTEEGRRMWDMLMDVAPAFLTVTNAADDATTATEDLSDALERQAEIQRQIEESVRNSRESQLAAIVGARGGLADFLDRTALGGLSPKTPQERLAEARKQYEAILAAAMSGDLGAAGRLGGAAETYLQLAREMFASGSGYISIYDQVMGQVTGVDQRLAIDEQMLRATLGMATDIAAQTEILIEVKALLIDIRDKGPAVVAGDTKPR